MALSTRPMTAAERNRRMDALGYGLGRNKKCAINGKTYRFQTHPTRSGGPINYFNTIREVEQYIRGVEQVRHWQDCPISPEGLAELTAAV